MNFTDITNEYLKSKSAYDFLKETSTQPDHIIAMIIQSFLSVKFEADVYADPGRKEERIQIFADMKILLGRLIFSMEEQRLDGLRDELKKSLNLPE